MDKIRVQMDAFLEDGSHEATVAVVRALVVAVPHTTDRLRDYILNPFSLGNYCQCLKEFRIFPAFLSSHYIYIICSSCYSIYYNLYFPWLGIHLLSKIFQLTTTPPPSSDVMRRIERANAFCESIRALDATGLLLSRSETFLFSFQPVWVQCFLWSTVSCLFVSSGDIHSQ